MIARLNGNHSSNLRKQLMQQKREEIEYIYHFSRLKAAVVLCPKKANPAVVLTQNDDDISCYSEFSQAETMGSDEARRGEARRGEARRGEARRGEARRGEARRGEARRGEARRGEARRGEARRGEARRGEARRGESSCGEEQEQEQEQARRGLW